MRQGNFLAFHLTTALSGLKLKAVDGILESAIVKNFFSILILIILFSIEHSIAYTAFLVAFRDDVEFHQGKKKYNTTKLMVTYPRSAQLCTGSGAIASSGGSCGGHDFAAFGQQNQKTGSKLPTPTSLRKLSSPFSNLIKNYRSVFRLSDRSYVVGRSWLN